jgi:hypothetical protein
MVGTVPKIDGQVWAALLQNPFFLVLSLPLCVLAWRSPAIIRALGSVYSIVKKTNQEVQQKQKLFDSRIGAAIEKKERRKKS